jgi:CTP:molybdopterin cytidylyltransferase MocA
VKRLMIVPAAGRGSRLGMAIPKLLVPVDGRAMIDYILERYAPLVEQFIVVVSPGTEAMVREHLDRRPESAELAYQVTPTGMLDAILAPAERVRVLAPAEVWITWCDQIAVGAATAERLASAMAAPDAPALVFPTVTGPAPYIHFPRDSSGRIVGVLQRREGDPMPETGESDLGLFGLSGETYRDALPEFAAGVETGTATRERNFLPFIPWLAQRAPVGTVPATHPYEAVGINTPDDLQRVRAALNKPS